MNTAKIPWTLPLTLSLCLWIGAACAPDAPAPEWGGSISDSAGIRIVQNPAEGLWRPGEGWSYTEVLKIGADVGEPEYEFGRVTNIQVDAEGLIYVFDAMAGQVRVYDQEGTHLRSFGGQGEGPGEFSTGAAGAFLTRDGRLLIPDLGNQRISTLSTGGEFLGSVLVSYASGFPVRWDADEDGNLFVQRRAMGFNEDPELSAGDPLVRIAPDGGEQTLVLLPKAQTVWMEGAAPRFRYFADEPTWDAGPGGTLRTAMTQSYRIQVRDPDGSISFVVTKPWDQRPVTEADRHRFEDLLRSALDRAGLSPGAIDRQIDNLSYGSTFPAFNQLMEGPDGTTLVQQIDALDDIAALDLSEEMSRRLGARRWDAFDAEGRFLGAFELPARFTPMVWKGDAVYGRWLDDLDRAYVLKLVRTPAG